MAAKIGALLLIVIVFGVVVYIFQSGAITKGLGSLSSFSLAPSGTSSWFTQLPNGTSLNSGIPPSEPQGGQGTTIAPPSNTPQPPPGFTVDELSPYYGQVRFGMVSPGMAIGYGYAQNGQISLYAANVPANGVDVTGWNIKGSRGGEFVPQAVLFYDPLGINPPADIILKPNDTAYLYSSSAPVNLRLNECIGYLPNKNQFTPPLPTTCPYIDRSSLQSFTGACQNYILSLGGCQTPNLSDPRLPQNDYACRQYVASHFSYRSCYDEHFADPNFLSHEVRVWMGSSPLDQYHDTVELLDKNGLLVDYYSY